MIEVVTNGKEKTYYARCGCGSELHYKYEDVQKRDPASHYPSPSKYIVCPVCGEEIYATMLTESEAKTAPYTSYYGAVTVPC